MTEIVEIEKVEVITVDEGIVTVVTTPEVIHEYITEGIPGPSGPPGAADKLSRAGDTMDAGADLAFSGGGEVVGLPSVPSTSSAASSKEYTDKAADISSVVTVIDYGADDKRLVLVNSTDQEVEVELPDVADYIGKHFHIKWWKGDNSVTMKAKAGQTADEENSYVIGERMDSLHVVGVSATEWAIV